MFKISDLARRDIINIADGAKLGAIKDMHLDPATGAVTAFVIQGARRSGLFSSRRDILVPWSRIKKIGIDAVLVDLEVAHRVG